MNVGFPLANLKNESVAAADDLSFIPFLVKCYKGADHFWPLDKVVAGTVFDLIGSKHGKADKSSLGSGPGYQGLTSLGVVLKSTENKTIDFGDWFLGDGG